ncbi:hypothetical protein [Plantactinospora sp. GCM10030261]|uniref:hypothetical protein n=1 Tax=Plantactinospora sp. GCM10030261 TaxID=3273420 RepID=UPI0036100D6D
MTLGRLRTPALAWQPHLLAVTLAALVWFAGTGEAGVDSRWPPLAIVPVALASGAAAWSVRNRRWPLFTMAAVGWLGMAAWPAPVVASYYAATRLSRRHLVGYLVGAFVVLLAQVTVAEAVGGRALCP